MGTNLPLSSLLLLLLPSIPACPPACCCCMCGSGYYSSHTHSHLCLNQKHAGTHTTHKQVYLQRNLCKHTHSCPRTLRWRELSDALIPQIKAMSAGLKSTFSFSQSSQGLFCGSRLFTQLLRQPSAEWHPTCVTPVKPENCFIQEKEQKDVKEKKSGQSAKFS